MSDNSGNTTKQQKEAIILLSIGTFLEYFDLMLYVHMAVLLNDLFFPKSDPTTAKLLAALTFCLTFVLRPIGGFVIGYIGDRIGRKSTIIITTSVMAICCITMATVGTYAEIGITASIIMVICRALQGFSSMGEVVGAMLYATETFKSPFKYIGVNMVVTGTYAGSILALIVASFSLSIGLNWRLAFWIGAGIALVGLVARTRLRESPEFIDLKRRLKIKMALLKNRTELLNNFPPQYSRDKLDIKIILSLFLVQAAPPICFYIVYVHIGSFMKESLGLTAEQVISHNLTVSILWVICMIIVTFIANKYHPIKIAKWCSALFCLALPFMPYWLEHTSNLVFLTVLQLFIAIPAFCVFGPDVACFRYIPVIKRFTISATTIGLTMAAAYTTVSLSLIPLTKYFGSYGLWFILGPLIAGFIYGINYIGGVEKKHGRYDDYPDEGSVDQSDLESLEKAIIDYNFKNPEEYKSYNAQCEYAQGLLTKLIVINQQVKTKVNIKLVEKAIIFAKKWHDGQYRKTGEPYYSHPLAVADIVAEFQPKTDVIIAAILHDVLEDSDCQFALIANEFDERIAQIVYRLTRVVRDKNGNKIKLTMEELISSLNKVDDKEAMLIKEVDRLHNLSTIEGLSREKQGDTANETLDNIVTNVAYTVDELNINNKLRLENDLLQTCQSILKPHLEK